MRLRFSAAVFIFVLTPNLPGQYYHLAMPADGSVVYFDTDYPRTGTTDARQGRIYTVDGSGLQVFAERQREEFPGIPVYTSYYELSGPAVSRDGATKAFRGGRRCLTKACGPESQYSEITVERPGLPDLHVVGGGVQLSSNGRYALLTPTAAVPHLGRRAAGSGDWIRATVPVLFPAAADARLAGCRRRHCHLRRIRQACGNSRR